MIGMLLTLVVVGVLVRGASRRWSGGADLAAALADAEAAGIITSVQREQILARAGGGRFGLSGAAWLGVFAGLFVVAGVSLLIARNWENIGPATRVVGFLVLLLAVGAAAMRVRDRALAASLPLELLWFFLPLVGIGLYAQTFQLSGDPMKPFLTWLALTAAVAWLSPRPVVAALHTFAMTLVLFSGNFVVDVAAVALGGPVARTGVLALTDTVTSPIAWLLSLLLLGAITVQSLRLLPHAHRHHCVGVWMLWLFGLVAATTPFHVAHEGWLMVAAIAFATLWVVALTAVDADIEARAAALLVWIGTVYALTFTWHMQSAPAGTVTIGGIAITVIAAVAAIGGALALPADRFSPLPSWARAAKLLLLAPLAVVVLYLASDVRLAWTAAVLMNVILIAIAVGFMWHGSLVDDAVQVNVGVTVLMWVLITRFLDVFGGMLRSGIGFIVAGLLLASLAWALERTRRRLIGTPRAVTP